MQMSRRTLLSTLPAGALLALAGRIPAANAADPGDAARVIANATAVFCGTADSNARPEVAGKLAAIQSAATSHLAAMDAAGSGELFHGLALGTSDPHLSTSFQYLYEIAVATRAPGSALLADSAVQQRVVDGLTWLYDHYYGDLSAGYYGNWFTWEIGISTYAGRTLVLLGDTLAATAPDLTATYVAAMDAYLRNGKDGDVDLDSRFHTGANLADITTNRILQGAALGDAARITKAVTDQLTVYATVDPYALQHGVTDGFYADGSFLQHSSVAYTGSYGTGLLTRVAQTVKLLDGTGYAPDGGSLADIAAGWVAGSFAPLVVEGWTTEAVKGRAVSRTGTGYADTAPVIEAATDLSGHATAEHAAALASYVKHLRQVTRAAPDPAGFVSPVSVAAYAAILADPDVPARDINPAALHSAYPAMDRSVHRRPGWTFVLARSSARISGYEYMSGENLLPWHQGVGAHYLYLAGQDQTEAFGVDYFTTVPPDRLAGVTAPDETRLSVPELYGTQWYDNPAAGFTSSSESQNAYVYFPRGTNTHSGGAALGPYGSAAMVYAPDAAWSAAQAGLLPADFTAYRAADATRSWFMLDDEVVVLAAGVGDSAGRPVTTTADARIAAASAAVTLTGRTRHGAPVTGPGTAPLAWLRYADAAQGTAVGYALLGPHRPDATVGLDTVTRSRRTVRLSNPDTAVTKQVFTLTVHQAAGAPHAAFAYAILPGASESQLRAYAAGGPVSVLANTTAVQAVRHAGLGLLGVNTFTPGRHRVGRLTVDGAACVLVREARDGTVEVAVADPTTGRDSVTLHLAGRPLRPTAPSPAIAARAGAGGTTLRVTTRHTYGASLRVTLH
ncbi:polysaccharide lyase family 8 super-sandwich domain-containing protein [Streptomyces sp. NRRL F-5123]|uniref:polysaccharide lyase family 8 super-sandwich domain-containing protein n=1 Tax=Streptomyces sp. NRRL F-5123 TaxID=1463856 RepID=UPI0004E1CCD9|nr:polysaccharide lyase family 8 super-sandwich domain-containing protein [Streptomyces sp. NRRL F-5123]